MWRVLQPIAHHEALLFNCSRALVQQINASLSIHGSSIAANDSQLWSTRQSSSCHYSSSSNSSSSPDAASSSTSSATHPWHLQDQIILKGLTFHGYHGALPEVGWNAACRLKRHRSS